MANNLGCKDLFIGARFETQLYGFIKVVEYKNITNVTVEFEVTGYRVTTTGHQIFSGSVKDKLAKTVCGVGFLGDGKYTGSHENRKPYLIWRSMLHRCYITTDHHCTYADCTVVDEWHNFQNFAKWYDENYPHGECGYELDKDIKVKGNRVYGPETCLFVTKERNLSEKTVPVSLMNGVTGEIFHFSSTTKAAAGTGMSAAQVSRLSRERRGKCSSGGWFVIE